VFAWPAGNQLPVVVLDILHKLVAEDQVVIVKVWTQAQ
jgi:hypothetical protein